MFCLLGPVEVWSRQRQLELGPPQRRAVLAAVAADAGRPVPPQTLVDRVWGERPPDRVRAAVHAHVTRIRRILAEIDPADPPARLVHRAGRYVLEVDPDLVDLHRFRRLAAAARDPGRPDPDRMALLDEALALWRGPALADLAGDWPARMRSAWGQERLDAAVDWSEAALRLGQYGEVTSAVRALLADYPLAEPLTVVLMRALAAVGRDAEALDCYATTRAQLVDDLGTEPGPRLRSLHEALLRGDGAGVVVPAAPLAPAAAPAPVPARPVPAQLPADVPGFTGRTAELSELDAMMSRSDSPNGTDTIGEAAGPAAVVISAVSGTAGVGKTALAVHWAHRAGPAFPDGQLYVNLRGYDPEQPMTAADALARFLRALGVAGAEIPLDPDERAARYRSELAGRRMLVVLDNAGTVEQVRPLLPGAAGCRVLVTSRDSLAGLVALHGARRLELDVLPRADAVALLGALVGARAAAEPDAAVTLTGQCGRLPLALRLAAELASARPASPLAELVDELADQQQRLDLLDAGGDPRGAVRAVLSWSYLRLPADAARAFRLLGLHPGPDLESYAVAALVGGTLAGAERLLAVLARAHLIQRASPSGRERRYAMHDLLRAYAAQLAAGEDPTEDRRAALTGLFDHYLGTAAAAMDVLFPAERQQRPRVPSPAAPAAAVDPEPAALGWLDAERANLTAVCGYAAGHGWPAHAVRLGLTLARYLDFGSYFADALALHRNALTAADRAGDRAGEAHAHRNLGTVYWRLGDYWSAAEHNERALTLHRQTGDRGGEARALNNLGLLSGQLGGYLPAADYLRQAYVLHRRIGDPASEGQALSNLGIVYRRLGWYEQAADHHARALALARQTGDRVGEAAALNNLGDVHRRLGRYEWAADHHQRALSLHRQVGDRSSEACTLDGLGMAYLRLGRFGRSVEQHEQALALYRQTGERAGEARALDNLGLAYQRLGRHGEAADCHQLARTLAQQTGDRDVDVSATNSLGETLLATGRPEESRTEHAAALALSTEIGDRLEQARAHDGLAHAHHDTGDPAAAREHWRQALARYADLGVPQADDVRDQLAGVGVGAARAESVSLRPARLVRPVSSGPQ